MSYPARAEGLGKYVYSLKFSILLVWCHLTKILCHIIMIIKRVPNFHSFYFNSIKLMAWYESILFTFGLPVPRWFGSPVICLLMHMLDLSNLTYKDFSKLKDPRIICNLTKLNNKIINTINHQSNYFTKGCPWHGIKLGLWGVSLHCHHSQVHWLTMVRTW